MDIVEKAMAAVKGRGLRVVLPEGEDERILRCAQHLSEAGLASPMRHVVRGPPPPAGHPVLFKLGARAADGEIVPLPAFTVDTRTLR